MKIDEQTQVLLESYNRWYKPITDTVLQLFEEKDINPVVGYLILKELLTAFETWQPKLKESYEITKAEMEKLK